MTGRILPDLTQNVVRFPEPGTHLRPGRKRKVSTEDVASRIRAGMTNAAIMKEFDISLGTVQNRRREAGLVTNRKARAASAVKSFKRHESNDALDRAVSLLPLSNPALSEGHTVYRSTVVPVEGVNSILVGGINSRKIGGTITKGRWKGFSVYTITLEERATCPTTCALWRSCYGNAMHFAKRLQHGAAYEERLGHELAILQSRHPTGFAVRLHVLGDFYSVAYVAQWRAWLAQLPALHVFGFTARHDARDPIAGALASLVQDHWPRFAVRFSNAPQAERSTITIEHPLQKPDDAVLCPQQLGKTASCSTCALCWQSERRIAFLRH